MFFYHIPAKPEHRQFLGIQWKSRYYIFNVLSFGANFSPYYFCKVVRFAVQFLRDKPCGLRLAIFVDDFLLMSHKDTFTRDKECFFATLQRLGWWVNWYKSSLDPSTNKVFIGYNVLTRVPEKVSLLSWSLHRDFTNWKETLNDFSHLHMWLHVCSPEWRDNAFLWPRSSFQQSCCSGMCTACSSSARPGNRLCSRDILAT